MGAADVLLGGGQAASRDERFVSGIDTRGAAAQCYFNSKQNTHADATTSSGRQSGNADGVTAKDRHGAVANHITVYAECTSLLRVMANKVLEVVQ